MELSPKHLGHKENLNKFKKVEITPYILLDHNRINLELNNKETTESI
jgi:hypothetical protein